MAGGGWRGCKFYLDLGKLRMAVMYVRVNWGGVGAVVVVAAAIRTEGCHRPFESVSIPGPRSLINAHGLMNLIVSRLVYGHLAPFAEIRKPPRR